MDQFKALFKNVAATVGRMTPAQVIMLFGLAAATVVGTVFAVGWITSVRYARLYSNLDQGDAGEVIARLEDQKINYRLSDNGTTVEIPAGQVYKTRISLASDGLPRGGSVGYSIFDQSNLGMTDFLQNLNFRRALEGELTRTIVQLREVQAARVHIVMPKERLFKEDRKEATASVLLKLTGAGTLSKHQINGIAHLVASSVEGLKPPNIAILDYDGNLLSSAQDADPVAGLSSSQLEVRKNVEQYLEEKAQTMLDGVLGTGKSVVRVTADLNFQQLERTSETYDPNAPSIRSEERTKSTNTTSDKAEELNESSGEENTEYTITNYELNKTVEHIINAIGGIERLSVAVTVDGTYDEVQNENGNKELIYQPRPQEEIDRLSAIVRNAVGFDQQRNDQLEVINISFDRRNLQEDREMLDTMYRREFYMDVARKVGLVLLVLFAFLLFRRKSKALFAALGRLAAPVGSVDALPIELSAPARPEPEVAAIRPDMRKPRLTDQMKATAKERPEEIAKVIKTMMIE
ncbi:MAG TPA: flagellar basal-body MS-ring/collar protein FliF [Acidobacteriota bacterium]|nr:flagellar basal-body MS-ring/collar protein FliF [Acidobacteriota bacterium]